MEYQIKELGLAASGEQKIRWVENHMPLLNQIAVEFRREKPLLGKKVALSVHLEAKTAYLCKVLAAGGAEMYITGSNPLSTQDDIAAALVKEGFHVYAKHGASPEEYETHIRDVISAAPDLIVDDGGDLVNMLHNHFPALIPNVMGGCEETTTGIHRLKAMAEAGALKFPVIAVNNAQCKYLFDNRYGTGQSVWDGINRTTNLIVAGKTVVVAGYGWCGKGVAMRAKGLGAQVIITEIDPIKAMEAMMDGFRVMRMTEAAGLGDLFITVTGCADVITKESFMRMKDQVILCNAGHFNVEINMREIEAAAVERRQQRPNIMGYKLSNGNWIHVIAEGRLVNLAAGDGHPAEIMDMSFAIQALCVRYIAEGHLRSGTAGTSACAVADVPPEIDSRVARMKLSAWGLEIDALTDSQQRYFNSWNL